MTTRWQFWLPVAIIMTVILISIFTVPDDIFPFTIIALPAFTFLAFMAAIVIKKRET